VNVYVHKSLRSHDHTVWHSLATEVHVDQLKYDQPTIKPLKSHKHTVHAADSGLPLCRETLRDILEVLNLKLIERLR
jgi:hypothetical protein